MTTVAALDLGPVDGLAWLGTLGRTMAWLLAVEAFLDLGLRTLARDMAFLPTVMAGTGASALTSTSPRLGTVANAMTLLTAVVASSSTSSTAVGAVLGEVAVFGGQQEPHCEMIETLTLTALATVDVGVGPRIRALTREVAFLSAIVASVAATALSTVWSHACRIGRAGIVPGACSSGVAVTLFGCLETVLVLAMTL